MKKLILTLTTASLLTGCMYQSLDNSDLEKAIKVCGGLENIRYIDSYFDGSEWTACKDSAETKKLWTQ